MSDLLIADLLGMAVVLVLVAANGFFVAAEFSLVGVRRSRVAELAAEGHSNAIALGRALEHLDAYLAATQLGITISSLALGWIGEPALSHLIEPLLAGLPASMAATGSHAIAVAIAFVLITALHIVLGELAPKSLALQRSERTSLAIVRPLGLFLFAFRPAISALNGLGNLVLKLFGLTAGGTEETLHSAQELKLLVKASHEAGILEEAQQEVLVRTLTIGERRVGDIMTPRVDVDWIDAGLEPHELLKAIRDARHDHLLVSRGSVDEPLGMLLKADLLNQLLDGAKPDPLSLVCEPLVLHEATPVFKVLEMFKQSPKRLAMVVDEYGTLEGILTQTDLLEAIAGELPENEDKSRSITTRDDGAIAIAGMTPAHDAFDHLQIPLPPDSSNFHTIAGFALHQFDEIPVAGASFVYNGWLFEVGGMDGRRIETLIVRKQTTPPAQSSP